MTFSLRLSEEQEFARQWAQDFAKGEMRDAQVDGLPAHRYRDGEKIWITIGGIADVHIVVATVDPNLGHRDARIHEIFEGTKEIQELVIGRQIARSFGGVSA